MKTKNNNFKQEWNENDFDRVYDAIEKQFGGKTFFNHKKEIIKFPNDIEGIKDIIGLPYTSTSMCAMVVLDCNLHILWEKSSLYHYDFVAIVDDKVEFFVKSNETENYKQIKL